MRWYIGLYADYEAAAAAAQSFLLELHNSDSDHHNAFAMAALAQKTARHTCLGRHLFTQWRQSPADGCIVKRELYVKWQGAQLFLGSYRAELSARAAMDAFLSMADRNVTDAVAAAKQVAIEEATMQECDGSPQSTYITPCTGGPNPNPNQPPPQNTAMRRGSKHAVEPPPLY